MAVKVLSKTMDSTKLSSEKSECDPDPAPEGGETQETIHIT